MYFVSGSSSQPCRLLVYCLASILANGKLGFDVWTLKPAQCTREPTHCDQTSTGAPLVYASEDTIITVLPIICDYCQLVCYILFGPQE